MSSTSPSRHTKEPHIPFAEEYKYERVETKHIDSAGNIHLKKIREVTSHHQARVGSPDSAVFEGSRNVSSASGNIQETDVLHERSEAGFGEPGKLIARVSTPPQKGVIESETSVRTAPLATLETEGVSFSEQASKIDTQKFPVSREHVEPGSSPIWRKRDVVPEPRSRVTIARETGQPAIPTGSHVTRVPILKDEESVRSSVTYTEERPLKMPEIQTTPKLRILELKELMKPGETKAEIHGTAEFELTGARMENLEAEEYNVYRKHVDELKHEQEAKLQDRRNSFRQEMERVAEDIRETLQRQQAEDLEFRKMMVELGIEQEEKGVQLEAEYAMRLLSLERDTTRAMLDESVGSSSIDVRIESVVGVTHSTSEVKGHAVEKRPFAA